MTDAKDAVDQLNEDSITYSSYLGIDALLSLQQPRSTPAEHDEMLFIVIHQTYELWFKLLIHELEKVMHDFSHNDIYGALHTLKRCQTVMKTLVGQLDILETMTPRSFSSFRDRLDKASGFQSYQFRSFEFLLGYKRPGFIEYFQHDEHARNILLRRLAAPSLMDHFYTFLAHRGAKLPEGLEQRDPTEPNKANELVQEAIYQLYQAAPETGLLFELMMDFDEGLQEWRYRHVIMVARTIGEKQGTGGSLGVDFLKKSLFNPIFPDLWAIRHRF